MIVDEFGKPFHSINNYLPSLLLKQALEGLEKFSRPLELPGQSAILDSRGNNFIKEGKSKTIKFRRYGTFKSTK